MDRFSANLLCTMRSCCFISETTARRPTSSSGSSPTISFISTSNISQASKTSARREKSEDRPCTAETRELKEVTHAIRLESLRMETTGFGEAARVTPPDVLEENEAWSSASVLLLRVASVEFAGNETSVRAPGIGIGAVAVVVAVDVDVDVNVAVELIPMPVVLVRVLASDFVRVTPPFRPCTMSTGSGQRPLPRKLPVRIRPVSTVVSVGTK